MSPASTQALPSRNFFSWSTSISLICGKITRYFRVKEKTLRVGQRSEAFQKVRVEAGVAKDRTLVSASASGLELQNPPGKAPNAGLQFGSLHLVDLNSPPPSQEAGFPILHSDRERMARRTPLWASPVSQANKTFFLPLKKKHVQGHQTEKDRSWQGRRFSHLALGTREEGLRESPESYSSVIWNQYLPLFIV